MKYLVAALIFAICLAASAWAQTDPAVAQKARVFLEKNCIVCHGAAAMSGLDLRNREYLLKGGKHGPAIIPGKGEQSLLFKVAAHIGELKMPPGSKQPASSEDLQVLKVWIDQGASWVETAAKASDPDWWSFRRVRRPTPPQVEASYSSLVRDPIDRFVIAKLREKRLEPAPPADKVTLIRRACFDLIGLPPTPEQVNEFLADTSADAFERMVEKLLSMPQYGERWARHWLDVVRYADSGGFETDIYYPDAWRYRDYVIKSFNDDKPYDRFVQEQIAGDELWPDNMDMDGTYAVPRERLEHMEARVGTGLYTFGPLIGESVMEAPRLQYERTTDWVDTTGAAFLGLTLGCARCHDHKFDPISQKDYFSMHAIFAPSRPGQIPVVSPASMGNRMEGWARIYGLLERRNAYKLAFERAKKRVGGTPVEGKALKIEERFTPEEQAELQKLRQEIGEAVLQLPETDGSHSVKFDAFFDVPSATVLQHLDPDLIPDTYVLGRGEMSRPEAKVGAGLLSVLSRGDEFEDKNPSAPRYRKVLALWLTKPTHPLTARVIVNRIWQWHFGKGLVATANDFGRQGQAPTHPELLDWLASEFVAGGWSVKALHRLIMSSYTYQMSSRFADADNLRLDPDNSLLWRANRRRLEAEVLWDSIHAVAGTINLKMGGRPVIPPLSDAELSAFSRKEQWAVAADPAEHNRRAVYIVARRTFAFPMFEQFDRPDPGFSCPRRDVTTVAPQSLWMINNQVAFQQALQLAARVVAKSPNDPGQWLENTWRIVLSRPPRDDEKQSALRLLHSLQEKGAWKQDPPDLPAALSKIDRVQAAALTELCLAVFNLSEFSYVD